LADAYDTGDAAWIAEALVIVARAKIRIDAEEAIHLRPFEADEAR